VLNVSRRPIVRGLAAVQDPAVGRTLLAHDGRARAPAVPGPTPPSRCGVLERQGYRVTIERVA
jgi:hypothetical protein